MPTCGDGYVYGTEICDDAGAGGCLADCSGSNPNFFCFGGNHTDPTYCFCPFISAPPNCNPPPPVIP